MKDKRQNRPEPAYRSYALAERDKTDRRTNAALPSEEAVIAAKKWVDENKK